MLKVKRGGGGGHKNRTSRDTNEEKECFGKAVPQFPFCFIVSYVSSPGPSRRMPQSNGCLKKITDCMKKKFN